MSNVWIKIHRESLDHWLYRTNKPLTRREAWENILLLVNCENENILVGCQLHECKIGQSLNSLDTWAKNFNWTIQQVRTFFSLLQKNGMINIEGLQKTTRLTVLNYDSYVLRVTDKQHAKQHANNTQNNKEKAIKDINNNTATRIENSKQKLYSEMSAYINTYSKDILNSFYSYWTEPNKSGSQMRFELEKTWDLKRRLEYWARNDKEFIKTEKKSLGQEMVDSFTQSRRLLGLI